MIKRVTVTISGKVQGVGYRFFALDSALEHDVKGLVKNMGKDRVYLEAEGEIDRLKEFLKICKQGPEGARVQNFDYESTEELKNFEDFTIEFE